MSFSSAQEGLLSFVKRSESEIRKFTDLYMQENSTIHERCLMFLRQKERLPKQIDELNEMMEVVDYECWYFTEAAKRNDIDYCRKLSEQEADQRIKDFSRKVIDFREGNHIRAKQKGIIKLMM